MPEFGRRGRHRSCINGAPSTSLRDPRRSASESCRVVRCIGWTRLLLARSAASVDEEELAAESRNPARSVQRCSSPKRESHGSSTGSRLDHLSIRTDLCIMCARLTGRKVEGASPLDERLKPSRVLREPCGAAREGSGEASVAVRAGSAMERRKQFYPGCRGAVIRRRQHGPCRHGEARVGPAASENTGTYVRLSPGPGRPPRHPAGSPAGALREGQ